MVDKICDLCYEKLENTKPNYVHNEKCGCNFHYNCYNKISTNYFSITFPKCPSCRIIFRKENLIPYENIDYEEAFEEWIGNVKNSKCKKILCFNSSESKYLNYCKEHYEKKDLIPALKYVFSFCMGLKSEKKFIIFKEAAENFS